MGGKGSGAKPKDYPQPIVDSVRQMYADGFTQQEIADVIDTTQKVVWRLMRRHGINARVAAKRNQRGPMNHAWKGDDAGYQALHLRVESVRGKPMKCEVCGTEDLRRSYDWANVTGDYTDLGGYVRMCRSCHAKHDGRADNIRRGGDAHASP